MGVKTILLVDDNVVLLGLMKNIFSKYSENDGLELGIITARDGQEAWEKIQKSEGKIALIFSDISMPRMNGAELYRKVRDLYPNIQFVFTSGEPKPLSIGSEVFFSKPIESFWETYRMVRSMLGE